MGTLAILVSLFTLSLPFAVLSNNFATLYRKQQLERISAPLTSSSGASEAESPIVKGSAPPRQGGAGVGTYRSLTSPQQVELVSLGSGGAAGRREGARDTAAVAETWSKLRQASRNPLLTRLPSTDSLGPLPPHAEGVRTDMPLVQLREMLSAHAALLDSTREDIRRIIALVDAAMSPEHQTRGAALAEARGDAAADANSASGYVDVHARQAAAAGPLRPLSWGRSSGPRGTNEHRPLSAMRREASGAASYVAVEDGP